MLEMLMHDDTDLIRNDAVKTKPFIDVSRITFMLLQTRKFSINDKVLIKIMNISDPLPYVIFQEI